MNKLKMILIFLVSFLGNNVFSSDEVVIVNLSPAEVRLKIQEGSPVFNKKKNMDLKVGEFGIIEKNEAKLEIHYGNKSYGKLFDIYGKNKIIIKPPLFFEDEGKDEDKDEKILIFITNAKKDEGTCISLSSKDENLNKRAEIIEFVDLFKLIDAYRNEYSQSIKELKSNAEKDLDLIRKKEKKIISENCKRNLQEVEGTEGLEKVKTIGGNCFVKAASFIDNVKSIALSKIKKIGATGMTKKYIRKLLSHEGFDDVTVKVLQAQVDKLIGKIKKLKDFCIRNLLPNTESQYELVDRLLETFNKKLLDWKKFFDKYATPTEIEIVDEALELPKSSGPGVERQTELGVSDSEDYASEDYDEEADIPAPPSEKFELKLEPNRAQNLDDALLEQIKKGVTLKKVSQDEKNKNESGRGGLIEEIGRHKRFARSDALQKLLAKDKPIIGARVEQERVDWSKELSKYYGDGVGQLKDLSIPNLNLYLNKAIELRDIVQKKQSLGSFTSAEERQKIEKEREKDLEELTSEEKNLNLLIKEIEKVIKEKKRAKKRK